jgi:ATP-dependent DNA ligase
VAKDPASPYIGGRTLQWLKVKQARYGEGERGWEKGEQYSIRSRTLLSGAGIPRSQSDRAT